MYMSTLSVPFDAPTVSVIPVINEARQMSINISNDVRKGIFV